MQRWHALAGCLVGGILTDVTLRAWPGRGGALCLLIAVIAPLPYQCALVLLVYYAL
jgi:hypothetical protein